MTQRRAVPRLLVGFAVAAAVSASCTATAQAQTRVIGLEPSAGRLGGPVLAGSSIVWTEGGQRLMTFDGSGPRQVERYADAADAMVPAASPEAVAVYREAIQCPDIKQAPCVYALEFTFGEVRAGTLAAGTTPLVSCRRPSSDCALGSLSVGTTATGWLAGAR